MVAVVPFDLRALDDFDQALDFTAEFPKKVGRFISSLVIPYHRFIIPCNLPGDAPSSMHNRQKVFSCSWSSS